MRKFISQTDMRNNNLFEVFSIIRENKSLTRKEVQKQMGLSWGGTSQIVSRLIELGYIIENKAEILNSSGRIPSCLCVNTNNNYIIGIDINERGIYAEVINLCNEKIYCESSITDMTSKDAFLRGIYKFIDSLFEKFTMYNIFAIGISMQGIVDTQNGISVELSKCNDWRNVPIVKLLSERYNVPVSIAHDPDCILFAGENDLGTNEDMLLLRIDDGIGMAVIKNGSLISDCGMLEIGETFVWNNLKYDKLSSVVSVKNFEDNKREKENDSYTTSMIEILGITIVNSAILFNVKKVLVCGSFMEYQDLFFDNLVAEINKKAGNIEVVQYSEKNAAFGAALFAIEEKLRYI